MHDCTANPRDEMVDINTQRTGETKTTCGIRCSSHRSASSIILIVINLAPTNKYNGVVTVGHWGKTNKPIVSTITTSTLCQ